MCPVTTFLIYEYDQNNKISKFPDLFCSTEVISEKPNYEIGSAAKLSFAKNPVSKQAIAAVWKLNQDDDDQEEINADDLLDEEDKVKPDPLSLKGTTNYLKILVEVF